MSSTAARAQVLREAARELGRVFLPFFRERLGAATDVLRELCGELDSGPERTLGDEQALAGVDAASAEVERLGWCLGVLGAAQSIDLLGARRRRDGLRTFVALLASALGCPRSAPGWASLPDLRPRTTQGWEAPFLLGWTLLQARSVEQLGLRWSSRRSEGRRWFEVEAERGRAPARAERLAALASALGGEASSCHDGERLGLGLPEEWLEEGPGGAPGEM